MRLRLYFQPPRGLSPGPAACGAAANAAQRNAGRAGPLSTLAVATSNSLGINAVACISGRVSLPRGVRAAVGRCTCQPRYPRGSLRPPRHAPPLHLLSSLCIAARPLVVAEGTAWALPLGETRRAEEEDTARPAGLSRHSRHVPRLEVAISLNISRDATLAVQGVCGAATRPTRNGE